MNDDIEPLVDYFLGTYDCLFAQHIQNTKQEMTDTLLLMNLIPIKDLIVLIASYI